ncbi:MAG: polyphosphate kinase 2 [Acidobacteriaceae bacterium]
MKEQHESYKKELKQLQIELVKYQKHLIKHRSKILVILEGRDSSGKDGAIKRITAHLSPRETRVVALGIPSDREKSEWYFQRYVAHLPAEQEFVLFNRSWYNRAGVERVMGFCTDAEYEEFFSQVNNFEGMLIRSGIKLFKIYLDISKDAQKERMKARKTDPLKQWKVSPIDQMAIDHWDDYSTARNSMFARSHTELCPWYLVHTDVKHEARLNIIKGILSHLDYAHKDETLTAPNPKIFFAYDPMYLQTGLIAP